jgi:hypothetical protein
MGILAHGACMHALGWHCPKSILVPSLARLLDRPEADGFAHGLEAPCHTASRVAHVIDSSFTKNIRFAPGGMLDPLPLAP